MSTDTADAPRISKRKLSEAISHLDDATNPPPTKKHAVTHSSATNERAPSVYASLASLGFGRRSSSSVTRLNSRNSTTSTSGSISLSDFMAKTRFWETSDEPQVATVSEAEQGPSSEPTAKPEPTGLRAILLRARKNPRSSGKSVSASMPPPDPLLDANPASRPAFLARLATFTRPGASYGSGALPDVLDAAHAAAAGWHCPASLSSLSTSTSTATDSSRPATPTRPRSRLSTSSMSSLRDSAGGATPTPNRLECATCKKSWVVSGTRGMARDAALALAKKQAAMLVEQHAELCPWRTGQCDLSAVYRITFKTPLQTAQDIVEAANEIGGSVKDSLNVTQPVTTDQLRRALEILRNAPPEEDTSVNVANGGNANGHADTHASPGSDPGHANTLTDEALILALFGWSIAPSTATQSGTLRRAGSLLSLSRATSRAGTPAPETPSAPSTPARPRLSSVSRFSSGGLGSPTSPSSPSRPARSGPTIHCTLCQARVGLWAKVDGEPIAVNALREHRSYCPYVRKDAAVLSLQTTGTTLSESAPKSTSMEQVEGWRAVLGVLLRYDLARRQRQALLASAAGPAANSGSDEGVGPDVDMAEGQPQDGDDPELQRVRDIIRSVKNTGGGREVRQYVRGLLGQ